MVNRRYNLNRDRPLSDELLHPPLRKLCRLVINNCRLG